MNDQDDIKMLIKEVAESRTESRIMRKQVDDMYTLMRQQATDGCAKAQDAHRQIDNIDKRINRLQGIVYTATAGITAAINAVFK